MRRRGREEEGSRWDRSENQSRPLLHVSINPRALTSAPRLPCPCPTNVPACEGAAFAHLRMSSSASVSGSAVVGPGGVGSVGLGTGAGGQQGSSASAVAVTAPLIEPPSSFGIVAPGIYRCSASSLTSGLPIGPVKEWKAKGAGNPTHGAILNGSLGSTFNNHTTNTTSSSSSIGATTTAAAAAMTPTESFVSSLQLKTILLLAPEKKPGPLAAWCSNHNVQLIHLGLGALADLGETGGEESNQARERMHPSLSLQKSFETYASLPDSGILSMERIVKDSLEIILHRARLPCLICDTSGVNETGVVVGCLRRMQRRSFASIRVEVGGKEAVEV